MKMKKKRITWFFGCVFMFFLCFLFSLPAKAANKAVMSDGNIVFETKDTKAISTICWMTAGFTIRKDKSGGNPLKDSKYGVVLLKSNYQEVEDAGDGTYHITYTIPKKQVDRALIEADLDEIKDGDTLYFNTIFKLKVRGVVQGKQYYRLNDIKYAACWRNRNDFDEHFDIGIKFKSAKYPVTVEYRTLANKKIKEEKLGDKKAGAEVSVNLDGKKSYGGEKYLLCKSYYINLSKPGKKKNVIVAEEENCGESQLQSGKVKIGGMKIVGYMKKKPEDPPEEPETEDPNPENPTPTGTPPEAVDYIEKTVELENVQPEAVLKAEEKGKEEYDVLAAIPSGEQLYAFGKSDSALLEYKFTKYEGSIVYYVTLKASYILQWQEKSETGWVRKQRTVNDSRTVYVTRKYSFYVVDYFNYYTVDRMKIKNEVLPSGAVVMNNSSAEIPEYEYKSSEHEYPLKKEITIYMGNYIQNVSNGSSFPFYPDYQAVAEKEVGKVKTKNDYLEFDGTVILDDTVCGESTGEPVLPEETNDKTTFYQGKLTIPETKENKEYPSEGYVVYKNQINAVKGASSEEAENAKEELTLGIDEINSVFVHTPIVCQAKITDTSFLCQSIDPNPARCQLVLDTEFLVSASCEGEHLPLKGYGSRNYKKYCKALEVSFPFDVYKGNTLCAAGSWNSLSNTETYYLPIWVEEGEYSVSFRATAVNGSVGMPGMETANFDSGYYAAVTDVPVEVSGRIYGLKNYDITDYPLWKNVFREKNSTKLSGKAYYVGTKNQNGVDTGLDSLYTLPVLAGSHPEYENTGYLKTGYVLRCSLKTIGSFYYEEDGIEIVPEFYFVDQNGENRERVDIYYDESVSGKYQNLIQVGSERDQLNIRKLSLGEEGMSVDEQEIENTAFVKGLGKDELREKEALWYGYKENFLSSALQTFSGISHMEGRAKPVAGMDEKKVMRSKQNWYFEYYLPSSYHIAPYGYDVDGYAKQYPVDFHENFWKTEGFLIVKLQIYADRNGTRSLSYVNENNAAKGYCNMWKTEGFCYERTDENGINFHLQDGDFAVFYYGKRQSASAGDDYATGGTH
jgi:hypothetical protein